MTSFFEFPEELKELEVLRIAKADSGCIVKRIQGMCADVYIVNRGESVFPNGVAVKIPRIPETNASVRANRFLREIDIEHRTFRHRFVGWAFDYQMMLDTPAALYRLWDGDLSDWIKDENFSISGRLATLAYMCSGLQHCRLRGLHAHQDLKPQNILMRRTSAVNSHGDIMVWPLVSDFGLANLYEDASRADGAKPYKAPEQWLEAKVIPESDIFSLGVIACELLSGGRHPIGEITNQWWPIPQIGNSKKWLRDDIWTNWAKTGNPLEVKEFIVPGISEMVSQCLQTDPNNRPTLSGLQEMTLAILKAHDEVAFQQVDFQLVNADTTPENHDWEYRNRRLELMKSTVVQMFR